MNRRFAAPGLVAGVFVALFFVTAAPAAAQVGTLKGKVVDAEGKPVANVDLVFEFEGELSLRLTGKTNDKGEWQRAGLSATGTWSIIAKKDALGGVARRVSVATGGITEAPNIVIKAGGATAAPTSVDWAKQAEIAKAIAEADTAMAAQDFDTAILKLTEVAGKIEKCVACYLRLGDVYIKKTDPNGAEQSYLKAIEMDPNSADAYDSLATLYNQQRKLDEAAKASAKAIELRGASGVADPTSAFNAGVIFWNGSKIKEAKEQFSKAIALQPTMAEAHYYLGMCLINEGNIPQAKASLEEYLKLAPTGTNAPTAKAILDSLPK